MPLEVRPLAADAHLAFVTERSGSFLQTPAWAQVKAEWGNERVGWYDGERLVGAGLVLLRQIPRVRRYLAYLPEGPVVDWSAYDPGDVLTPLLSTLRRRGAFTVKIGPQLVTRRWSAETVKAALAATGGQEGPAAGAGSRRRPAGPRRLGDLPPDATDATAVALGARMRDLGWRQDAPAGAGFGDFQPRYVFQLPLAGRTDADLLAGFNQLWRRNIRKADKDGVQVVQGTADDLPAFHRLYVETASRDGFAPRPLAYFQRMFRAMTAEDPDRLRLYLASRGEDLLAATTWVRVGGHVWYSYGASSTAGREHRGSNAVQWRMVTDAVAAGASVYDLRGISDTLAPDDHLVGLVQFKLGTGGEAVEYLGEWDYPLSPVLHKAFQLYLARR
jgi:lipid II:glycine glycyltransferase (peptidoglycan interpeptide bridge formation enzyme)